MGRARPWLVLLVLPSLLLLRGLLTHSTLLYDDLASEFYPERETLYHLVQAGHFPLWDPYPFGGMPQFADPQSQMLYPLNWLFMGLPTAAAVLVYVAAHQVLAGVLTYRWLRLLGRSEAAATLAGLVFSLSAWTVFHASQLPVMASGCWLPAGFLTIERLGRCQPRWREAVWGAILMAQALLAGFPQVFFICTVCWLAWLAWRWKDCGRGAAAGLPVTAGLALLLALPQVLASRELLPYMARNMQMTFEFASSRSFPPQRWWTLLAPYAFGNPAVTWDPSYTFQEVTFFVGCIPLLLAVRGGLRERSGWWLGWIAVAAILALGTYTPLYRFLFDTVPGFASFRVPARWFLPGFLGLAVLASAGFDDFPTVRTRETLPAALLMLAALGALLHWGADPIQVGVAAVAIVLFLVCERAVVTGVRGASGLLVGLVIVELAVFSTQYVRFTPTAAVHAKVALLAEIPTSPSFGRGMPLVDPKVDPDYGDWMKAYGIRSLQGYHPVVLGEILDYLCASLNGQPPAGERRDNLLQSNGYFGMAPETRNPMLLMMDMAWALVSSPDGGVKVFRIPGGYGPGWAVGTVKVEPRLDALQDLFNNRVDPHQMVTVESPVERPVSGAHIEAKVAYSSYQCDSIEYDVAMAQDGYLVTSEVYYPGWHALVDGQETPMLRAYGLMRTFFVPRGTHHVEVILRPFWLPTLALSAVAFVVMLLSLLGPTLLRPIRREPLGAPAR